MEGDFERRAHAITDIQDERGRQIRKGWTSEHDDERTKVEWSWIIGIRVNDLLDPAVEPVDARQLLVEIAAIAVAGIEQMDRAAFLASALEASRNAMSRPVGVTDVTDAPIACPTCGSYAVDTFGPRCQDRVYNPSTGSPDPWHFLVRR